jgi:hypothetical protein
VFETPIHRLNDGVKPGEQGSRGEQVREKINSPPTQLGFDYEAGMEIMHHSCDQ